MPFVVICHDKPNHLDLRLATRDEHITYLKGFSDQILMGGPMLDGADKPMGSTLVVDLPDRAAAEAFAENDPYAKAGLFEKVEIQGYKVVFQKAG